MGHGHEPEGGMGHMGHMGPMHMGRKMKMMGMEPMGMPMGGMGPMMGMCPWCGGKGYMMGGRMHKSPFKLAKHAKKEVLYEKVKAKIEQKFGDKLDIMADEIVALFEEKMQMKMEFAKKKMGMQSRMWEMMAGVMGEEEGAAEEEAGEE